MKPRVGLILTMMVLGVMLLSGVVLAKTLPGGPGNNNYMGTKGTDYIFGKGGSDDLGGKEGRDWLYGDGGNDRLHGGRGRDELDGGPGKDTAWGDAGRDVLTATNERTFQGSIQAAKVKGGRKLDRLLGGRGNDTITAENGKKDIIRGGPGRDKAYVDPADTVEGIEVVPDGSPPVDPRPVATIDRGPQEGETLEGTSVTFAFSANEPSAFECRLKTPRDSNPAFASCESPKSYYKLTTPGSYTFELLATDKAGNPSDVVLRNFKVCIDGVCSA